MLLDVDIPDKIICSIDKEEMERAMQNILVNAVRYSPDGEKISIIAEETTEEVCCQIENTGVNIPEDTIPHLFEAFYRADNSRNSATGGGIAMFLSIAGFVSANPAQNPTETTPPTAFVQDTVAQGVLCQKNGDEVQFTTGGNEWVSQSEYEQSIPKIEWWTASDYEVWIEEQRTELEALIGTGDGWFDGQDVYHEWTQDNVNAAIAQNGLFRIILQIVIPIPKDKF